MSDFSDGDEIYLTPPAHAASAKPRRRWQAAVGLGLAAALVAGAGVAIYAYQTLASSGIQPERVLPADTAAFAKLDLDPAANQKIAVYRLGRKIGSLKSAFTNQNDIQDAVVRSAVGAQSSSWNYQRDIKPWLGSRLAVAAVPDPSAEDGLDPIVVLAYTDRAKMQQALARMAGSHKSFGYTTERSFVLISDTQAHAERVAKQGEGSSLADDRTYSSDLQALPGDQIADAFTDYGRLRTAVTAAALKAGGPADAGSVSAATEFGPLTGRTILGLHANADYLEISGTTHSTDSTAATVAGKITSLPTNTQVAAEIAGLGNSLSRSYDRLPASMRSEYADAVAAQGISLPSDLRSLFGTDLTVAATDVGGAPKVAVHVSSANSARAVQLIDKALAEFTGGDTFGSPFPLKIAVAATADNTGFLAGNDPAYNALEGKGNGGLGGAQVFKRAVPDVAGSSAVIFVNVGALLDASQSVSPRDRANWAHVSAFGLAMHAIKGGSSVTMRLTTR